MDIPQIRRTIFVNALFYINNVDEDVLNFVKTAVSLATDAKLENVQQTIGITNNSLVLVWADLTGNKITNNLIDNFLYPVASHLINIFNNNNLERNLNADFMTEGRGIKERKARFLKGSQEAKDYMASIRSKKGKTTK